MASTYSSDLRIELIANGEQSGTWGSTTNNNLGTLIEDAISGKAVVTVTSSAQALTALNGVADQARCAAIEIVNSSGGNCSVYVPPVTKLYVIRNTSSLYTATVYANQGPLPPQSTQAAGVGIAIPPSKTMFIRCDNTDMVDCVSHLSSLTLAAALPVTSGGTGFASYNIGDLLYASSNVALSKLAAGGGGTLLVSAGPNTAPTWGQANLVTAVIGTLPINRGGTGLAPASVANSAILIGNGSAFNLSNLVAGTNVTITTTGGNTTISTTSGGGGGGTVTSVGLSMPSIFSVSGSPVTSSGTLSASLATQSANQIFAGPASGSSAVAPTFRALVAADIPKQFSGVGWAFGGTSNPGSTTWPLFSSNNATHPALVLFNSNSAATSLLSTMGALNPGVHVRFQYSNSSVAGSGTTLQVGSISSTDASTSYTTTSDYRFKENVVPLTNAVTKLKLLAPKRFNWKGNSTGRAVEGFLAHEVQAVVPDAVTGDKDAVNPDGSINPQQMDSSFLIPLLTAALQEAVARIEALEAQLGT